VLMTSILYSLQESGRLALRWMSEGMAQGVMMTQRPFTEFFCRELLVRRDGCSGIVDVLLSVFWGFHLLLPRTKSCSRDSHSESLGFDP